MLVSTNDSSVDHHVFIVVIAGKYFEDTLENSALCPPAEALVDDLPVAEAGRQITPGDSGSTAIKNSIDEQSVIRCSASDMAFTAGQKILDPLPLVVA